MENFYYYVGFSTFLILSLIAFLFLFINLFEWVVNQLGKRFKNIWIIIEFQFYRKEFKEWVKTKERHEKMQ
jgi:hypothetical protein